MTASAISSRSSGTLRRSLTLLFVSTLTVMSGATITPSLPALEAHFAGEPQVALLTRFVLTVPALAIALFAPFAGLFIDRFGRQRFLAGSVLLFVLAGSSGLFLDSLTGLLVGRVVLGLAVGGITATATALAGDYFAGPARERFLGQQAAFSGLGGLVFLSAGGLLADIHWRGPFLVYASALLVIPAVLLYLRDVPPAARAQQAGAPASLTGRSRALLALLLAAALFSGIAFYLVPTQLPFLLAELGIATPSRAGLALGLMTLVMAITSFNARRLGRLSQPTRFALGFGLIAIGFGLASLAGSYAAILPAMILIGAGVGMLMPTLFAATLSVAPPAIRGRVSGGLNASLFLGMFLSPLVSQPWIEAFGFQSAYRDMGLLLAVVALVTFAAPALLGRRAVASVEG